MVDESCIPPCDAEPAIPVIPILPGESFCAWVQHGKVVNAFPHGVGDPTKWDFDGYFAKRGFHREPLYTLEQMRQYALDAIAALNVPRVRGKHEGND